MGNLLHYKSGSKVKRGDIVQRGEDLLEGVSFLGDLWVKVQIYYTLVTHEHYWRVENGEKQHYSDLHNT